MHPLAEAMMRGSTEDADSGVDDVENTGIPGPDEHRHEGDVMMREHMNAVAMNDHQGAHDAMMALINHHMASRG